MMNDGSCLAVALAAPEPDTAATTDLVPREQSLPWPREGLTLIGPLQLLELHLCREVAQNYVVCNALNPIQVQFQGRRWEYPDGFSAGTSQVTPGRGLFPSLGGRGAVLPRECILETFENQVGRERANDIV